ncbi:hypothetical protein BH24GEM1_BH24GEM1_27970 [soil metagenome]|nr:hypothetical protein [Gemmatimonadales bacterium]
MDDPQSRPLPEHPIEELAPQTYCQRAALELAALVRHQRKPRHRTRRESALLRRCVEQVLGSGEPAPPAGPWQAGARPLKRPGRGGLQYIPIVTRGKTTIMLSTQREAEELATFLNYCGTQELGG